MMPLHRLFFGVSSASP
jgi:hypothetical protein